MNELFRKTAHWSAKVMGSAWAFVLSTFLIIVWLVSGPWFDFSDTWQLYVNTATTVLTFLMVFLIQNTQNRDAQAIQLKLDEIIRALGPARNDLIDIEDESDSRLDELEQEFKKLRHAVTTDIKKTEKVLEEVKES